MRQTREILRQKMLLSCPECGGVMRFEKRADVLSYKGRERTIETLGWWCTQCGVGILSGDALRANEQAFQAQIFIRTNSYDSVRIS